MPAGCPKVSMFAQLKLFVLISMLIVIGFTVMAGTSFRNSAVDDLARLTEKTNGSIAQGYIEAVWNKYRDAVATVKTSTPEQIAANQDIMAFAQETVRYFKKMPLLRVNIYGSNGMLLLSSNVSTTMMLAGKDASPNADFILKQLRGTAVSSQMLSEVTFNNGERGTIMQTLIPIHNDGAPAGSPSEGAIEVLYDLTAPIAKFSTVRMIGMAVVIGMFMVFFGLFFVMSRLTEAIITKQHETNVELAAAAASAQSESRDKSQFLANISHELRTPLNAIIGFSEIIKNNSLEEIGQQKFQEYISDINSSGIHLLSLINDILDYSKAEAGKLELDVAEVKANKLVHNCVRLVQPRAESGEVTIVEAMPKEVLTMITDGKKFKQIMLNLLSNAVKFTPPGGQVHVTAWVEIGTPSYTFEVRDTGIGIAPKDISRAMAPFGQVDSALSRKYEGTGLGLPLTKKFVELMGGKFNIESEVGNGTTIRFTLPRELTEREGVVIKRAE